MNAQNNKIAQTLFMTALRYYNLQNLIPDAFNSSIR